MVNDLSKDVTLKNIAKHYVLKGEKYRFGGPIYYNNHTYWVIYYSKAKLFKKSTPTCLLVLDENYNIITNRDVYSKITLAFLYPRPTSEFLKLYIDDIKEISVIKNFFSRPKKFIGRVNISELRDEIQNSNLQEIAVTLNDIIEQSSKIEEISSKLLQVMDSSLDDVKKLVKKLSWENIKSFVENVVSKEYELLVKLVNAFVRRSKLLIKLVVAIEKLGKRERSAGKIHLLLNDTKTEIDALERLNIYFEKLIKIREGLRKVCEESQRLLEEFFEAMVNRVSTVRS